MIFTIRSQQHVLLKVKRSNQIVISGLQANLAVDKRQIVLKIWETIQKTLRQIRKLTPCSHFDLSSKSVIHKMFPKKGLQHCGIKGSINNVTRVPFNLKVMEQV